MCVLSFTFFFLRSRYFAQIARYNEHKLNNNNNNTRNWNKPTFLLNHCGWSHFFFGSMVELFSKRVMHKMSISSKMPFNHRTKCINLIKQLFQYRIYSIKYINLMVFCHTSMQTMLCIFCTHLLIYRNRSKIHIFINKYISLSLASGLVWKLFRCFGVKVNNICIYEKKCLKNEPLSVRTQLLFLGSLTIHNIYQCVKVVGACAYLRFLTAW